VKGNNCPEGQKLAPVLCHYDALYEYTRALGPGRFQYFEVGIWGIELIYRIAEKFI